MFRFEFSLGSDAVGELCNTGLLDGQTVLENLLWDFDGFELVFHVSNTCWMYSSEINPDVDLADINAKMLFCGQGETRVKLENKYWVPVACNECFVDFLPDTTAGFEIAEALAGPLGGFPKTCEGQAAYQTLFDKLGFLAATRLSGASTNGSHTVFSQAAKFTPLAPGLPEAVYETHRKLDRILAPILAELPEFCWPDTEKDTLWVAYTPSAYIQDKYFEWHRYEALKHLYQVTQAVSAVGSTITVGRFTRDSRWDQLPNASVLGEGSVGEQAVLLAVRTASKLPLPGCIDPVFDKTLRAAQAALTV